MTDQQTSTKPATEGSGGYNVIAVSFEDDRNAYSALTSLKELDSQKRVGVQEAVVVVRGEDGQLTQKDSVGSDFLPGMTGGGLMGLLLGIIGGPFGMLIGSATGLFIGSLYDIGDLEETESALSAISSSVKVGGTALLAVVNEQSPEVVDAAMSGLGGTVLRRSVGEVEAEIAAAEEAARKAKWEARKELLRGRHEHNKAAVEAKIAELKAKVHSGPKAPSHDADKTPAVA
jgi:uncharacterized membrane protein